MLNAKQFTFHLARYAKVSEADAETFMQAVTKVLLEQINAGEDVSIQGLGTFSVVETQQGRRLAFQVDDKMRSQVNAPFACFEPMALAVKAEKNADNEERTEAEAAEETPETPEVEAAEETPETSETETVEEPSAAPDAEETPVAADNAEAQSDTEDPEAPAPSEDSDGKAAAAATAVLLQSLAVAKDKEEAAATAEPAVEDEPVSEQAANSVAAEESVAEPAPAEEPAVEPTPEPQHKPAPTPRRRVVEPEWYEVWGQKMQEWAENQAWLKQVEEKTHLKPWMVGAIAGGLIVVLLIILLAVSCGGSEEPKAAPAAQTAVADSTAVAADSTAAVEPSTETQPSTSGKAKQTPTTSKTKTAAAKTTAKQTAKSSSKSSSGNYVNSSPFTSAERPSPELLLQEGGSPKQVKLEEGERLTLLALSTYGDKAFWAYIYDVNAFQLGDPNNVPTNIPLYLPEPTYFHIDASNPASIKRAQNRAMQILNDPQSDGPWGRR
ncbi:MAG: HU family DNA-binding protein [Bacteroidales bacterium]|nr:HU family DNA-binding protein [Bacteroidales bacterium]